MLVGGSYTKENEIHVMRTTTISKYIPENDLLRPSYLSFSSKKTHKKHNVKSKFSPGNPHQKILSVGDFARC